MSYVKGLRCRECHKQYPQKGVHVCEVCFGPLEVEYDYEAMKGKVIDVVESGWTLHDRVVRYAKVVVGE